MSLCMCADHASGGLLTDSLERQNCVCGSEWECNQISLDFRLWRTRPCPVIATSCRGMTVRVDVGADRAVSSTEARTPCHVMSPPR